MRTVVYDLGFARPAAQPRDLTAVEQTSYSLERIREHDADILLTATYATGGHVEAIDAALRSPLVQSLGVARRGELHVFNGDALVGASFEHLQRNIEYLRSILVDRIPNLA